MCAHARGYARLCDLSVAKFMHCTILGISNIGRIDRFCGVVVITSALHAEGREFEPRQNLLRRDNWAVIIIINNNK